MGTNINNSWEKIQQGVKDVERLIGQKEYNASMVKSRQTLEFMVALLSERAAMGDNGDLKTQIDDLYQHRWINKTTCEHYHKIRIIGNKAAHEGDTNAYNANQAYHMLSQEVYTFANDYRGAQRGTRPAQSGSRGAQSSGSRGTQGAGSRGTQNAGSRGVQAAGSRSAQNAGARSAQGSASRSVQSARRPSAASTRSRRRQTSRGPAFTIYDLLKLLVPILCIILLVCVVKLLGPGKDDTEATQPTATEAVTEAPTDATQPTETAAPVAYKTTDVLNVRPEPSTDSNRIGQLEAGASVEYVRAHDETWAVILYNGQEAYVASQYLTSE